MSDNFVGATRELTNVLMENNLQIQKRLVETCAAMEHYVSRFQSVEKSIEKLEQATRSQQNLIDNQKTLVENLRNDLEPTVTKIFEKVSSSLQKGALRLNLYSVIMVLVFAFVLSGSFGFFFAYQKSEDLYLSDKRALMTQEQIDDLKLINRLKKRGVTLSDKEIIAPQKIVENTGKTTTGGFGIFFKD